ncbi:hypothetical protein [Pimelobacter simplex]|uniref:hypothetical protein n=1 Tax=Nocardioides simplex TaxID=2045 RepID=UPI003AAE717F
MLKAIGASAVAVGGGVLSWGTRAAAETSPDGTLGWNDCRVDYAPDADTGGRYYGWRAACNGATYRSSDYCNAIGWHRKDSSRGPGGMVDYIRVHNRCWSPSDGRNAWRWTIAASGNTFRCSDGRVVVTYSGGGQAYNTVCRWQV